MRNSQGSSSHQGLHIRGVNLQGFVVLVHGFDVAAVFEVGHTCAHAAKSGKDKQKIQVQKKKFIHVNNKAFQMNVCRYHFRAQDADCFFLMTEAKSSF